MGHPTLRWRCSVLSLRCWLLGVSVVSSEEPQWHGEVLQSRVALYFFFFHAPPSLSTMTFVLRHPPTPFPLVGCFFFLFFSQPVSLHSVTNFLVTSFQDQRRCLRLPLPDQDTSSCTREQHGGKVRADWWMNGRFF